jgi:hypothetical protein
MEHRVNASQTLRADELLEQLIAHPQSRKRRRSDLDLYLEERADKIRRALDVGNTIAALASILHTTFDDVSLKTLSRKIASVVLDSNRPRRRRKSVARTAAAASTPQTQGQSSKESPNNPAGKGAQRHAGLREDEDL